jgi:hypothetical protein
MCWVGLVLGSVLTVPAEAALLSRLDGRAAYDDVLDITWVTDAGLSGEGGWREQVAWADGLSLGGAQDWRLASISVAAGLPTGVADRGGIVDCSTSTERACRDNELGYMYYHNLGGSEGDDLTGNQTVDGVDLMNIQSYYWSGTELDSTSAWDFNFGSGTQGLGRKLNDNYGWAVRSGDIAVIPVPPAVWLFGSGLLGLLGLAKRKRWHLMIR